MVPQCKKQIILVIRTESIKKESTIEDFMEIATSGTLKQKIVFT
jgi:hypothetical protein